MDEASESRLTVFGAVVLELMARRGISTWSALAQLLEQNGCEFKASRISNWAYGRHAVDKQFGQALSEVLKLTEEEQTYLARAFLFGQERSAAKNFSGDYSSAC